MIQLTPEAIAAVKAAIAKSPEPAAGLRIMVQAGGCAGYKYMMGIAREAHESDAIVEADGVRVFIDDKSQPHIAGTRVDFVTGLDNSGFTFDNPNAAAKCACGKSFG